MIGAGMGAQRRRSSRLANFHSCNSRALADSCKCWPAAVAAASDRARANLAAANEAIEAIETRAKLSAARQTTTTSATATTTAKIAAATAANRAEDKNISLSAALLSGQPDDWPAEWPLAAINNWLHPRRRSPGLVGAARLRVFAAGPSGAGRRQLSARCTCICRRAPLHFCARTLMGRPTALRASLSGVHRRQMQSTTWSARATLQKWPRTGWTQRARAISGQQSAR